MKIYDITRTLQSAPVYPGDPEPEITPVKDMETDAYRLSRVTAGSHSGTHADAFSHFLADGAAIDEMPLELYCGPCRVLSVPGNRLVRQDDLQGHIGGVSRIVLHGGGSAYLSEAAAEYLAACRIKAVVTDACSIAPQDNEAAVHEILMRGGTAIVENAELSAVPDGDYLLFAFPAKYGGCDGAPVRAVLLQGENGMI